ncbi:MAG: TIR domain-containing protein [Methylocella sp.]
MARRPTPSQPQRPVLTVEQKRHGIARLEKRIKELEAFDPQILQRLFASPEVTALQTAIDETLAAVFGHGTVEYNRYEAAARLDKGPFLPAGPVLDYNTILEFERNNGARTIREALALLRQSVRGLEEEIEAESTAAGIAIESAPSNSSRLSRKVFVVHGHDDGTREAVARFLEQIGFDPIILHEQANQGRTVIEKFEGHADVGFAVVLLTPDDVGGPHDGAQQPRARQNVILELGYFISRLGRKRVCAIKTGEMEIPSDIIGVGWTPFDPHGAWRKALGKEIEAAGYEIDWNKIMRS